MAQLLAIIEPTLNSALRLEALCEKVRVSERTLRLMFTREFGIGPNRYLRRWRLHLIRAALASTDANHATVNMIARRFGITDAGRMAAEYRKLFGEYPSTTLNRRVADLD
jgi:AraC family ethanolamine operon transcriptional activator